VCTSAIAVLNWELGFGNICLFMALGEHLEKEFWGLRRHIQHVTYIFILKLQWVAFEKFGMFDSVLTQKSDWAQYGLTLNLYC
jgi:hypothetical protein